MTSSTDETQNQGHDVMGALVHRQAEFGDILSPQQSLEAKIARLPQGETVDEIMEVGACCPSCAANYLMLREAMELIQNLKQFMGQMQGSPLARMLPPGLTIPGLKL